MESISTPRRSGLPWAANLATLAVVVVTTWWSGAQRPAPASTAQVEQAAQPQPGALPAQQPAHAAQPPAAEPLPLRVKADGVAAAGATVAQATLLGGSLAASPLQPVAFKALTR